MRSRKRETEPDYFARRSEDGHKSIERWIDRHGFILAEIAAKYGVSRDVVNQIARDFLAGAFFFIDSYGDIDLVHSELSDHPEAGEIRHEVGKIVAADPLSGQSDEWDGWSRHDLAPRMLW
jgi:hypothetical protein